MKPILRDETSVETNGQLQSQVEEDQNESTPGTRVFFVIKAIFGFIFYLLVLVCTVFSKLTLVSLTDKLREITFCNDTTYKNCPGKIEDAKEKVPIAVSLYWQLLLVMMVPTFIAFLRSLVFGVLGKTKQSYPWPKMKSAIVVSMVQPIASIPGHTSYRWACMVSTACACVCYSTMCFSITL